MTQVVASYVSTLVSRSMRIKSIETMMAQDREDQGESIPTDGNQKEGDKLDVEHAKFGYKRTLHFKELVAYGVASTLGAGIFVTAGSAAKYDAGPSVVISFFIASLGALFSGLCYAELAARVPLSGSAMTYAYATLGEIIAWWIGWNLSLEYGISGAAVARVWSDYFVALFDAVGYPLPVWLSRIEVIGIEISLLSGVIVFVSSLLLLIGAKESGTVNMIFTVFNVILILFICGTGSTKVSTDNWIPFAPFGVSGIVSGGSKVFFSYIGFDTVATLSEETVNPSKTIPAAILTTLAIVSVLYFGVGLVLTGMIPFNLINETAPLTEAFKYFHLHWAVIVIAVGTVTTLSSTVLCSLFGQPRLLRRMSLDGLLFKSLGRVNKNGVPIIGVLVTFIATAPLAIVFDVNTLSNLISIGTLIAFTVACCSIILLRYKPHSQKKYLTTSIVLSFYIGSTITSTAIAQYSGLAYYIVIPILVSSFVIPVSCFYLLKVIKSEDGSISFLLPPHRFPALIPCCGIFFNIYLIVGLPVDTLYRLVIWSFLGFLIYIFYGQHNSKLNLSETSDSNKETLLSHYYISSEESIIIHTNNNNVTNGI